MAPIKTLNGAENGKVYTDQTGLQSQTVLSSDHIIHTYLIPEIRTENSWRQKTVNKIVMSGDFVYNSGSNAGTELMSGTMLREMKSKDD